MELFTQTDLQALVAKRPGPCLSVYLATHPGRGEENVIHWKTSLAKVRDRLEEQGMGGSDGKELLIPAFRLLEDVVFWRHAREGLACFLAPSFFHCYRLPLRFADSVDVDGCFQVKPLLPLLTSNGRFFILAISQNGVRLLQGSHHAVSEIDLTKVHGIPKNLADTLKYDDKYEPLTFHTRPTSSGAWAAIFSGHGVGIDDHKNDLLRYFQDIDRGLHAILKEEKAPLILASVDFLRPLYRQANSYAHLLEQGIGGNPDHLSAHELHGRAWQIVEPVFTRALQNALGLYQQLAGTGRTTHELSELVPAAYHGQVDTLFVALDKSVWGAFDPEVGIAVGMAVHAKPQPGDEDLLNYAAVHALRHHRHVYALPASQLPDGAAAAAIYCLPLAKRGKRP